jgi:predicted O-linked N-acetylglucosamine transferase (SPINDLY family)
MTCEALWMGVPVVCLVGQTHVARVDLSLLTSVGLPQLAASDADAFVHAVKELVRDRIALAKLRCELRERMKQSPLTDGVRLARQVESAYRAMWQTYCGKMPQ